MTPERLAELRTEQFMTPAPWRELLDGLAIEHTVNDDMCRALERTMAERDRARDLAVALEAELAEATRWRPVDGPEEPGLWTDAAVYDPTCTEDVFVAYYDGSDWLNTEDQPVQPTHWMPLPEPPQVTP